MAPRCQHGAPDRLQFEHPTSMQRLTAFSIWTFASLFAFSAHAQTPTGSGTITGKVFNPNTGQYVRNAEIRIEQTAVSAVSEAGGEYRLSPVPAGKMTIVVTYTGYRTEKATVEVAP